MPPLPSAEGSEETIRPAAAREVAPSVMGGQKTGHEGSRVAQLHTLEENIQALCRASLTGRASSYSPYSRFAVGAALLCGDGSTVLGCNVENASYGLAICAERTAVVKAVSGGQHDFLAIAIAADAGEQFVGPCGACRQFMAEFNPDLPIYLVRPDMTIQVTNLDLLLPDSFTPKRMTLAFHNGNV